MDDLKSVLSALKDLLIYVGGVAIVGLVTWVFRHAKAHQRIDDRLEWGREQFAENAGDHKEIKSDLKEALKGISRIEGRLENNGKAKA